MRGDEIMNILDFWSLPKWTPRESQVRILETLNEAFESYDNVILNAGVGIGKSAIATTLLNSKNNGYIITMTNQLLNQYLQDFNYLYEIKGRGNYPCLKTKGTCNDCLCDADDIPRCSECPYLLAVREISEHDSVITNYDYLYYGGNFAGHLNQRDLLVFDEAHNFEKKVMSLISESLNRKDIYRLYSFDIFEPVMKRKPLKSLDKEYWKEIIEKCLDKEKQIICVTNKEKKASEYRLKKYKRMLKKIDDYIIDLPMRKLILSDKDVSDRSLKMTLKPLKITDESRSLLRFGRQKLFMTGTLGDKDKFCEWNGIDSNDTYYHYEKSPFPVENRPIYNLGVCSMKNGNWKNTGLIRVLKKIINDHTGKGVIHTSSNEQAWWIKKNIGSKRVLVVGGKKRNKIIQDFKKSPVDLVLVGAGIKDGVDLSDDSCRYQILFKVPFPNIGDEQVRQRKKLDESWYMYQTVMPLMQSYGRGVRHENDTCEYYILDRDFNQVFNEYTCFFNEYFTEAIRG